MWTLLLRLVHHLLALGEFMRYLMLFPSRILTVNFLKKTTNTIQEDSKALKKLPTHLGVLLVEDDFSFQDLANIIVWAVTMGIAYISIYDINGEVKRKSAHLQDNINTAKEEIMGGDKSSYDIQLFSSTQNCSGPSRPHQACVSLLCMEDGQKSIVQVTQRISHMVSKSIYNISDIVPLNMDAFFQESLHFPDPELCLKFGSVDSLCGYIPWQIRLTEIISLSTHKGISYKSFLSSLSNYATSSQRFGK